MAVRPTREDAWIVVAIGGHGEWSTLRDVITSADYLNRMVPRLDELEGAINHLGKAGLIDVSNNGYALTSSGVRLLDDFGAGTKGVIALMLDLMKAWEGTFLDEVNPDFQFALDRKAYLAATADYRLGGPAG